MKKYTKIFSSATHSLINRTTSYLEYCLLSKDIYDYRIVSQGKTTIPSVDDGEEFEATDVRIGQTNLIAFYHWFVVFTLFILVTLTANRKQSYHTFSSENR